MGSYRTVMLMAVPNIFDCVTMFLDNVCYQHKRFETKHVIIYDFICWFSSAFVRYPLIVEVFRQVAHFLREPGSSFFVDAFKSALTAIVAAFGVILINHVSFNVAFELGGVTGLLCHSILGACVVVLTYR